jgi:LDH2 family malate/lactate/ureidoglycolate dehydrogenase
MPILQAKHLLQFTQEVFEACGSPSQEAAIVADHLIGSNLLGVDSHGVMRIPQYVREVREGGIRPGAPVVVVKEDHATAVVDCGWNFGQVGAVRAMEVALRKARQYHTACVVTQRCGHAGRLGAYMQLAAREGFLALGACNSPRHGHFVLPWGGREGRLATNPISFAIPAKSGHPIFADFSTAAAPEGKIRLFRDQGRRLPEGWIVDAEGAPSTDPADFYGPPMGAILPFGRETGYRGFALSLLVEVLGGSLAGLDSTVDQPGNGVAYVVIDVSAFLLRERFDQLVMRLRDYIKSSTPAEGFEEVLLPGEPELRTAQVRQQNGILLDDETWQAILRCAESLGVKWRAEAPSKIPTA